MAEKAEWWLVKRPPKNDPQPLYWSITNGSRLVLLWTRAEAIACRNALNKLIYG